MLADAGGQPVRRKWPVVAFIGGVVLVCWGSWKAGPLCHWFLPDAGYLDARVVEATDRHVVLRLALLESKGPVVLEKISLERTLQDALGLRAPEGFVEEGALVPPEHPSEAQARMVADYNRDVHFSGALTVGAGRPIVLRLPVQMTRHTRGRVTLTYRGSSLFHSACPSVYMVHFQIGDAVEQMALRVRE
jgi:hypothetical protein